MEVESSINGRRMLNNGRRKLHKRKIKLSNGKRMLNDGNVIPKNYSWKQFLGVGTPFLFLDTS